MALLDVRRRIEILERSFLRVQDLFADVQSMEDVLPYVSDEDLNLLLAGSESEAEGRALTAREMQAQRDFVRAVAQSRLRS
ncbi:MAG: hypothetical protein M3Y27_08930 [Acidobacteriota bacterium]|nr:hypothetical protein [Acidobacteriota bacterium]